MRFSKNPENSIETLRKREDFVRAAKAGEKWVSSSVIVQALKAEHDTRRIGYTITKKIFKSAVKRNRVKRRLRAAASDVLAREASAGYDYVLIGRAETFDVPYDQLCKDLRWCLKRLHCLSS